MRPVILSVAASPAVSSVYAVDIHREGSIALFLNVTGAASTFSVEHTYDDVFAASFDPSTATWLEHGTLKDAGADAEGSYTVLPRGIRLKSKTGTATATLTIIQMGLVS